MATRMVYMTASNMDEAAQIAKTLIHRRLAACVNIIDGVRSLYEWDGTVQDEPEVVLIAKTHTGCLPALVDAVKSQHSYECPCIVALAVSGGNNAFLDWVNTQVDPQLVEDEQRHER